MKQKKLDQKALTQAPNGIPVGLKSAPSPFGYFGAKLRLARRIADMLPPHNAWVEVFCGSAAVTLAKKPCPIEIINDADSHVVNLFRQLREKPKELSDLIELTPYSREEFEAAYQRNGKQIGLEGARRFLVASMMTVNGAMGSNGTGKRHSGFSFSQAYARNGHEARVNRWNSLPTRLSKVTKRLKNLRIENRDALALFRMFLNRPATLAYLDPPYLMERDQEYRIDANEEEFHKKLLKLCLKAKCMVLVSGYANPLYDAHLTAKRGWKKVRIETHTRDTKGKDLKRTEVLWENKAFVDAVKSGRVPIRLTKAEQANNKVNPVRK